MREHHLGYLLTIALVMCSGANASDKNKMQEAAAAVTPDRVLQTISIKDDSLDTRAQINTINAFQEKRGLLKIVWNDNFLRAFVDKRTGEATIQVYQFVNYSGDWRTYNRVNYETPDGPQSAMLTPISRDVTSCSGSRYGGCSYSEHFAFEVDEKLLRVIASLYKPGQLVSWKFKYYSQSGQEWPDGMLPAEVVGFLSALDRYRQEKGLPTPQSTDESTSKSTSNQAEAVNSELRRRAKEALDRGDTKAAKEYLEMIKE